MGTGSLLVRMVGVALFALASVSACRGQNGGEATVAGYETRAVATSLPAGASVVVSGYTETFWTRLKGTRLYTELAAIPDVREPSRRSRSRSASSRPRPASRSTSPRS
jgi:hypothetical protein